MTVELIRDFLLWCAVINYGILLIWFVALKYWRDLIYGLHGRWFRISIEQFDMLHYGGMVLYKIGILFFNVVPLISILIIA